MQLPWANKRCAKHEAVADRVAARGRKHRYRRQSRARTALMAIPVVGVLGIGGFLSMSLGHSHVSTADSASTVGSAGTGITSTAHVASVTAITPLHTHGAQIVNAAGKTVTITGVNWFGLETGTFAPDGRWARNYKSMLDQVVSSGFNAIRLPYSNALFKSGNTPNGIDYQLNPDLKGLRGLPLMDKVVNAATSRGLMVILDQHRPDQYGQSCLPVAGDLTEQQWISDWAMLAKHYSSNPLVVGADLHNEPCGNATWGPAIRKQTGA